MEYKVNYTVVGFFVVVFTGFIIAISLWLTQHLNSKSYNTYLVYMTESVAGLTNQAAVKYNGVDVGYVSDLRLDSKNPDCVILTLKIEEDVNIVTGTEAVLMQQGLTGIAYVGLRGGTSHDKKLVAAPGERYPIIKAAPSFFVRLDQSVGSLNENIQSVSKRLNQLVSDKNIRAIEHTLDNLDTITSTLASRRKEIDKSIVSLDVFLGNAAIVSRQFPNVMADIHRSSAAIQHMSGTLSETAEKGNVALDSLTTEVLPEAYLVLKDIKSVAGNMQSFSDELATQPSVILSGKKSTPLGPGEK